MDCGEQKGCGELRDANCHEHGCGECCGHEHGPQAVRITLENGENVDCAIVGIFDVDDKEYIALLPDGSDGVIIYGYNELEDGDVELSRIEDDAEYEEVADVFLRLYEEEGQAE